MRPSKIRATVATGALATIAVVGIAGYSGVAGAATGTHGSAALAGDNVVINKWTLSTAGFTAKGTLVPGTFIVTMKSSATKTPTTAAKWVLGTITVKVGTICTIAVGLLTLTKSGANTYTGTTTILAADYTTGVPGGCGTKPAGTAVFSLTT